MEFAVGLIKNYCITVSMQKISLSHTLIPTINIQKTRLLNWFALQIWLIKKIIQSDWLGTFWPISQEQNLSQIWDLCRNTVNINFHYITNSVKINAKFFNKFKKPCFGPFLVRFPNLGQIFFSQKSSSIMHNLISVSSTMPKFRKKQWYMPSKKMPGQMVEQMEGRLLLGIQ